MSKFSYIALYRTLNIDNKPFKKSQDDWKVELFQENRTYEVIDDALFTRDLFQRKIDPDTYTPPVRKIHVGDEVPHFAVTIELDELDPQAAEHASDRVDEVVTILCLIYNASIVGARVFKHFLASNTKSGFSGFAGKYAPQKIDPINTFTRISKTLEKAHLKEDGEFLTRMLCSIYSRNYPPSNAEQYFLDLWLLLDIHPMGKTGNAAKKRKKLAKYLSEISGIEKDKTEDILKLKHLERVRGHLAHHGTFEPVFTETKFDDIDLLTAIVDVCLRDYFGFKYLNQFAKWMIGKGGK